MHEAACLRAPTPANYASREDRCVLAPAITGGQVGIFDMRRPLEARDSAWRASPIQLTWLVNLRTFRPRRMTFSACTGAFHEAEVFSVRSPRAIPGPSVGCQMSLDGPSGRTCTDAKGPRFASVTGPAGHRVRRGKPLPASGQTRYTQVLTLARSRELCTSQRVPRAGGGERNGLLMERGRLAPRR